MSENATLGSQDFTEESDEERELVERIERHLKDKAPNKQEKAVDNEGAWSE
ncbi:MAG: hypothetical protein LBC61_04325 [Candidatus Peribacteria bacterium]|jgi:hypothetical protein|nr:hypothetical protein [Candidatus Peribacteria bacterium]